MLPAGDDGGLVLPAGDVEPAGENGLLSICGEEATTLALGAMISSEKNREETGGLLVWSDQRRYLTTGYENIKCREHI